MNPLFESSGGMPGTVGTICWAALLAMGLTACGGGDTSSTTAAALTTPDATAQAITRTVSTDVAEATAVVAIRSSTTISTAGVLCGTSGSEFNSDPAVNLQATYSWTCSATARVLAANGVPNHPIGTWQGVNAILAQTVSASYALAPAIASKTGTSVKEPGHALNGIKLDPGTAGTCDNSGSNCNPAGGTGSWSMEALGLSSFRFGTDVNNAHSQPDGTYHYHGVPEGLVTKLGGTASTMRLVGWAGDGFPIYVRVGYTDKLKAGSGLKTLTGSYRTKATPDANRPATSLYAMGSFTQDWEYAAGVGDLDECNGRTGVTPEFPTGTYHYYITDSYPFIPRCLKGTVAAGGAGGPPTGPGPRPL